MKKASTRIDPSDLKTRAQDVLVHNDLGGWTSPSPGIYPHQWLWDSCFVAIGLAHVNPERAARELHSLVRGQWSNGMMPHMLYNSHLPYRLEAMLWGTTRLAPRSARTSGLTQPPLLTVAVERVAHALPPAESKKFVRELLPIVIKFHEWIYRERDPHSTGLAACIHPWESGLDDTPYWTEAMERLPKAPLHWRWLREYRPVNPTERATPREIQQMLAMLYPIKHYNYQSRPILEHATVALYDLVFNAILAAANESLERLAESAGHELPPNLHKRFAPTRRALEQLWDSESGAYYSRDFRSGHLVRSPTIATFMPLFAGTAAPSRAQTLRRLLVSEGFSTPHPIPSVPTTSAEFEPQRYWRGPVWINMNWFIVIGLERYGFTEEADWLRTRTVSLVRDHGFREYFNPHTGDGLGANHFSWTAALTLDLLSRPAHISDDHA